jgi:ribosome-dependent ATPase
MLTFGYGISFDVEHLPFAVYDQDQSPESRQLVESFQGSRYFQERPPIASVEELQRRLQDGELMVAIEIPPDFGRDLMRQERPEVSVWLDGAMPFRAETARGYVSVSPPPFSATLRPDARDATSRPIRSISKAASATIRTSRAPMRSCRASSC